jgi:hypothetical protein
VEMTLFGENLTLDNFFVFSMARSTMDMWKAGAKELAIVILIFSGIWPYMKQLITLVLWFLPPSKVSVQTRGSILVWLDALAKWSMVDIFGLVISLVAFRITVASPTQGAFELWDFYNVELLIVPMWGLYANMTAQLVSQVSSHFIIYYHRQMVDFATEAASQVHKQEQCLVLQQDEPTEEHYTVAEDEEEVFTVLDSGVAVDVPLPPNMNTRRAKDIAPQVDSFHVDDIDVHVHEGEQSFVDGPLSTHAFIVPQSSKGRTLQVRCWVNYILGFACAAATALILCGCFFPSFSLEILGILGLAVEFGQEGEGQAITSYGVWNIVKVLFEQAAFIGRVGDWIGLCTLAILFLSTVMLVPIVQLSLLMYTWFGSVAVQSPARRRLRESLEIVRAWQYLEVYLLSMIFATWQVGDISGFLLDDLASEPIKRLFDTFVNFGMLSSANARFFRVTSQIQLGAYLLFAGAVVLATIDQFVSRGEAQQRQEEKELSIRASDIVTSALRENGSGNEAHRKVSLLAPGPIRFTDCFKWLVECTDCDDSSPIKYSGSQHQQIMQQQETSSLDGSHA